MTVARGTWGGLAALAAAALAAGCGGRDEPAAVRGELRTLTTDTGFPRARVGSYFSVEGLNLEVTGVPAAVEAIGVQGGSPGLLGVGVRAVPTGSEDVTTVGDAFGRVWPPARSRPVEGLRIAPGRVGADGRPAADGVQGPWDLAFGFRVTAPGPQRLGTAVIAFRQGGRLQVKRVPLTVRLTGVAR